MCTSQILVQLKLDYQTPSKSFHHFERQDTERNESPKFSVKALSGNNYYLIIEWNKTMLCVFGSRIVILKFYVFDELIY